MIAFQFHVNRTFLDSQDHAITIPGEFQFQLRDQGAIPSGIRPGAKTAIAIILSDGRRFDGHVFYGEAGGKFFYQIRASHESAFAMRMAFRNEQSIQVIMGKVQGAAQVYLLDSKVVDQVRPFLDQKGPQAEQRLIEELEKLTAPKRPNLFFNR